MKLLKGEVKYCFECDLFPCEHLEKLDAKYVIKYNTSFIENLNYIKKHGEKKFLAREKRKWKCKECGGTICIHNKKCYDHEYIETWKG
ncbi:MAG: hypothetical protein Q7J68_03335 [Thermoplasmata archaeon]|nr:hypothetical protein [Thermoplasmata archaeon]